MSLSPLQIPTLVERYIRERDRFEKMAATVGGILSERLRTSAVPHVPTFRSKEPESLRLKLERDREKYEYARFEGELTPELIDLAGVRILLYRPEDVTQSCSIIEALFDCGSDDRYRRDYDKADGYQACHRVVTLHREDLDSDPNLHNLDGVVCEIQAVTLTAHIWNELEHDIKYKTPTGRPSAEQEALLKTLRSNLSSATLNVELLMEATAKQRRRNLAEIDSPDDLKQALHAISGRALVGDLGRLLDLLAGVLRAVTRAELERLPLSDSDLDRGGDRLAAAGKSVGRQDAVLVVGALWDEYGKEFEEVVSNWAGRPGPVKNSVRALAEAPEND